MIKMIVLRVHRATASSGLLPKPDISLHRLGDAKGHERPFALQQTANLFAMPPGRGRRHRHRRAGAHLATPDIGSVLESLDLW